MTPRRLRTASAALIASLGVLVALSPAQTSAPKRPTPPKVPATAQQIVPAEYQAGISQLRVAKAYLQKAGNKWGGYRIKGIAAIDQTFKTLGVSAESTPNEMQSGDVDEPGMMNNGISSLQTARAEFEKAANDWGGRKQKAIALIDQSLKDLQTGIDWAKEHKTY